MKQPLFPLTVIESLIVTTLSFPKDLYFEKKIDELHPVVSMEMRPYPAEKEILADIFAALQCNLFYHRM
jgi:hypothetical protein